MNSNALEHAIYPHEPNTRWDLGCFNRFLVWAAEIGASDVKLAPRRPAWIRKDGEWLLAGQRDCYNDEIAQLVNATARAQDASERCLIGPGYEYPYEVTSGGGHAGSIDFDPNAEAGSRYRFRANGTGCRNGLSLGIELTMRSIPEAPPTVTQLALPDEVVDNIAPLNGLVIITGTMGSGKTTSLAALLRHINENQRRSIATFEQPIEFDLTAIDAPLGPVAQSEVGRTFSRFADAARNAIRRAEDIVLIGESRDHETIDSMLEIAEIGSLVFTTLHTRSVIETPNRIINLFPERERPRVAIRFASAIRMIIYQRLVTRLDPTTEKPDGRTALIEYLPIDSALNAKLSASNSIEYRDILKKAMADGQGRTLSDHASALYNQGYISAVDQKAAARESNNVA